MSPAYFDQVRRVSNARKSGSGFTYTKLTRASLDDIRERLDPFVSVEALTRRWEQVCLKSLPDAMFAEGVILVEGEEDAAVLEGMGDRVNDLAVSGVCVASVSGKSNMTIPFAILQALGIPALMVVDNDSGCADRMVGRGRSEGEIETAVKKHIADNRLLCRFVGEVEEDFPVGAVGAKLAFVPDTMETLLSSDLPGWDLTRQRLIAEGRGVDGKNAATYALASRECRDDPGEKLQEILDVCADVA